MKYFVASSGWPAPNSSPREHVAKELRTVAAGAVHDQHGVVDMAVILVDRAERAVVHAQFRQRSAVGEFEIADDVIAFRRRGIRRRLRTRAADERQDKNVDSFMSSFHGSRITIRRISVMSSIA